MNFALYFMAFFAAVCAANPSVRLSEYLALGSVNTSAKGNTANLFLGLPYALPPVGLLRFEKPIPLFPNYLKTVDATKWPKACHQVINATVMGIISDEDCLYLNVMTPPKENANLPVLVFIHGGGYEYGATEEFGWEYFVDNFVSQDVIMVTLQYRLAHFGFLATKDFEISGNFGNFDQLEALKFIKRNIKAFGGDSNKITLAGHSAGSVSVHSLSLSPKTVGLFNQEIHIAGSDYSKWPIDNKIVMDHSLNISRAVGCDQSDTVLRKLCLKTKPIGAFWDARKTLNLNFTDFPYDVIDILYWTSVYDNDFFAGKTLEQLQQAAPKRNVLYGYDAGEGLLWSLSTNNPITNVFAVGRGFTPENRHKANASTISNLLEQILYDDRFTEPKKTEIKQKIFDFYKIGEPFNTYPLYYFDKLTELYSDLIMKVPTGKEIKAKIENGWQNQHLFIYNYTRPQDAPTSGHLPGHGYFLMYFAGFEIYTFNGLTHTPIDEALQQHLAELFTTFVKTGNPSANGIAAPKITNSDYSYLEFNPNVVIDNVDLKPKVDFWDGLAADYKWDFVRGIPL